MRQGGFPEDTTVHPRNVIYYMSGLDSSQLKPSTRALLAIRYVLTSGRSSAANKDGIPEMPCQSDTAAAVRPVVTSKEMMPWLWMPMFWLIISRFDYGLFILSTRYLETAVSTTIFEIWPIITVLILARLSQPARTVRQRTISVRKIVLMSLAFVGVAIVIYSQHDLDMVQVFRPQSLIGIGISVLGGFFAGSSLAASIHYGDLMYDTYRKVSHDRKLQSSNDPESVIESERSKSAEWTEATVSKTDDDSNRQTIWFTIVGFAISCITMVPMYVVIILLFPLDGPEASSTDLAWMWPALALGVVIFGAGTMLLRQANIYSSDLGVNSLYFITPIGSLMWLSIVGIALQREDLLWIGASLVFSMNGLIESNPDEEPDYDSLDSERPWGTRLGFTSLILSFWLLVPQSTCATRFFQRHG